MKSGEIIKSLDNSTTEQDMELVNRYTRRAFAPDEVYIFSVVLCDNDVDRDFERFTVESLFQMEKLFVGKTGIYDHSPRAVNQTARILTAVLRRWKAEKHLWEMTISVWLQRHIFPDAKALRMLLCRLKAESERK